MTRSRWAILAVIVLALMGLQHFGLERQEESKAEAPYRKIPNQEASDVIPTYVASLFFGAFRAVAIDVLWIQLKKVEEERRWYEHREIVQLISYFQPRNPEVWAHLGWHSAYNVANGFTDPEESWDWVKFGLKWLRRGNEMLPNSSYLKFELAFTLFHKPTWRDGSFDLGLLRRIEQDPELQKSMLAPGTAPGPVRTAFELAIPWLELARNELFDAQAGHHLTQMGLYLYPSSMDGYIRRCMILQGMYEWRRGRPEEAKEWFRRAKRHVEEMLAKNYRETLSPIFKDWTEFYAEYPRLVDLERKARGGGPDDERAYVAALQALLAKYGPLDEGFFWIRDDPEAPLNARKQRITRGQDPGECNDSFEMAAYLLPGNHALANLDPEGMDVDYYLIPVQSSAADEHAPARPARPVRVDVLLSRPDTAKVDLKVTVFAPSKAPLLEKVVKGKRGEFFFEAADYGAYRIRIEPAEKVSPWPADTRYGIQYSLTE